MKNAIKITLFASTLILGGFVNNARAEGEWTNEYPRVASNNIVGGGPVVIANTGNSAMPTETRAVAPATPLHAQAEARPTQQAGHTAPQLGSQSSGA